MAQFCRRQGAPDLFPTAKVIRQKLTRASALHMKSLWLRPANFILLGKAKHLASRIFAIRTLQPILCDSLLIPKFKVILLLLSTESALPN